MECKTDLDCWGHKGCLAWLSLRVWFWMEIPPSAPLSGYALSSAGWSWKSTFQADSPDRHWSGLPRDVPVTVAAVWATRDGPSLSGPGMSTFLSSHSDRCRHTWCSSKESPQGYMTKVQDPAEIQKVTRRFLKLVWLGMWMKVICSLNMKSK